MIRKLKGIEFTNCTNILRFNNLNHYLEYQKRIKSKELQRKNIFRRYVSNHNYIIFISNYKS